MSTLSSWDVRLEPLALTVLQVPSSRNGSGRALSNLCLAIIPGPRARGGIALSQWPLSLELLV